MNSTTIAQQRAVMESEIFNKVLADFENGNLEYIGKGKLVVKVTDPKQAWAMAHAISKRRAARWEASQSSQPTSKVH